MGERKLRFRHADWEPVVVQFGKHPHFPRSAAKSNSTPEAPRIFTAMASIFASASCVLACFVDNSFDSDLTMSPILPQVLFQSSFLAEVCFWGNRPHLVALSLDYEETVNEAYVKKLGTKHRGVGFRRRSTEKGKVSIGDIDAVLFSH